uniref:Uncharacterized protein n=1 Tax=Arundo donax TaxID=35708 RepID=A0A0A9BEU2_ARUDO
MAHLVKLLNKLSPFQYHMIIYATSPGILGRIWNGSVGFSSLCKNTAVTLLCTV